MFADPIKDNVKETKVKSGWDFSGPKYDERSSCFINAGTHHGVGHKQPVGSFSNKTTAATLPYGRVSTMRIDEKG